ncbi:lysostaphin resistance A-like protein [Larkinella harenae]
MTNELRPFWNRYFSLNWQLGLFLLLIICVPRFILVLKANSTGNYSLIGVIMVFSAICPFVFLSRSGRQKAGLAKPRRYGGLLVAFLAGLIFSILLYYAGHILYGNTDENWYTYIGRSYKIPERIEPPAKTILFAVVAGTSMLFSPVGEELFFRGIVHASFANSIGDKKASLVDSSAFAITHLSHFGLVFVDNQWRFFPLPAFAWVLSMFLVSRLFFFCKTYSGSIAGAICCHSAFNLGMTYCIFYWL